MFVEELPQRVGAEILPVGYHVDDTGKVGKEVALVPVGQDRGDGGVVKLDILVVYLDEVNRGVSAD